MFVAAPDKLRSFRSALASWYRATVVELRSTCAPSRILVILLCGVLLEIGLALFQTVSAERRAREQVEVTTEALSLLRRSLLAGIDAETGERGFLLTGDPVFLEPYEYGSAAWLPLITRLQVLEGTPSLEQGMALARLEQLAAIKLHMMAQTIDLARSGNRDKALGLLAESAGKRAMDEYRAISSALEEQQAAKQQQANDRARAVEARAVPIIFMLGGSIFGLIVVGLWLERRTARARAAARDAQQLREAHDRYYLLTRELNHRVKNLFSVILSIVALSGRGETDAKRAVANISSRIYGLSLAHAVSQGQSQAEIVQLDELLTALLKPYALVQGRIRLDGEPIELPAKCVTPLGLIIHELATNAVKHGALSVDCGKVEVRWTRFGHGPGCCKLELIWKEYNGPAVIHRSEAGFGSTLIQQASSQLNGRVEREWFIDGLYAKLTFHLETR